MSHGSDNRDNEPEDSKMSDPKRPYKVGPGNPPKEYQYPKGVSGNPRGRPPKKHVSKLVQKLDPLAGMVLKHDEKVLTLRSGANDEEITRGEAALEKLYKMGMNGDYRALSKYWDIRKEAINTKRDIENEMLQMAMYHIDKYLRQFITLERLNKPLPSILPDPRDILIDENNRVQILGPVNRDQQIMVNQIVKERDSVLEAIALVRKDKHKHPDIAKAGEARGRRKVNQYNRALPPRLRKKVPRDPDE